MSDRYTKADVARILENVNSAAERLGMAGAGSYAVETMGGSYLYLTDRSGKTPGGGAHGYPPEGTGLGSRLLDLGNSWHKAGGALLDILQAWHVVEMMRSEARARDLAAVAESVPESAEPPAGVKCPECETYYGVHQLSCSRV